MKSRENLTPANEERGNSGVNRREFIKGSVGVILGTLLAEVEPVEAQEKKRPREVEPSELVLIKDHMEQNPENFRKRCDMRGPCNGTESTAPFSSNDFAIRVFKLDHPKDPNIPIFKIIKKFGKIEITIYNWKGEETGKSTLTEHEKDQTPAMNALILTDLLKFLKVIKEKS